MLSQFAAIGFAQTYEYDASEDAIPIEQTLGELKSHLQVAAKESWDMDLQDLLVDRGEAASERLSASKSTKVRLSTSVGYEHSDSGSRTTEGLNFRYNVSATKPLYHWGAVEADHQMGLLGVDRANFTRKLKYLAVYRSLVNSFLDYLVLKQQAKSDVLNEKVSLRDLELHRDQEKRGEYPTSKLANDELTHKRLILNSKTTLNRIEKAEQSFRILAGLPEGATIASDVVLPPVPRSLDSAKFEIERFVDSIATESLRLQELTARLEQENQRLHKYEGNNRPKVDALIRSYRDTASITTGTRGSQEITESFAGVSVNWSIFDGGYTKGFVLDALTVKRQLERELTNQKDNMINDLDYAFSDLEIIREQNLLVEEQYLWAVGKYEQELQDVKEGRSAEKELEVVELALEKQRIDLYRHRASFYKALAYLYVGLEHPSILAYLE